MITASWKELEVKDSFGALLVSSSIVYSHDLTLTLFNLAQLMYKHIYPY